MNVSGMNMVRVKNRNRSSIVSFINRTGPVSRKDIAEALGLTAAAVTQISLGLIQEGILYEKGVLSSEGAGRKKVLLDIDYDSRYVFSINIEIKKTTVVLCNVKGDICCREDIDTDSTIDPEEFICKIADACERLKALASESVVKKIYAASVAVPGLVDKERGVAVRAYGIWDKEVDVCSVLSKKLSVPCIINNNVNAFANASTLYGVGRTYDNLLVVKWGPGVGGTIVIDNKIYEGRHDKAAELGHFIVKKDGIKCNCGRKGCLETLISYNALNKVVPFEEDEFADAYERADAKTKEILDSYIDLFARSIVNMVTVLAPNRVELSGFLFKDERIRRRLIEYTSYYDSAMDERRILYTTIADKEDYIGPVAAYVFHELFDY